MPSYYSNQRSYARPAASARRPYSYSGNGAYRKAPTRSVVTRAPYRRAGGKGAYTIDDGPWANRGAAVGGLIGSHFGGPAGKAIGSWVGRRAFHYPAKVFGSGSYNVGDGASEKYAPLPPKFENDRDGVTISHREYLGDLITSATPGALSLTTFDLNPAVMATFPWLSQIAGSNFQQYRFDGCIFEFKSFSADALNSTNTALGAVFSAINYDFNDEDFRTRGQIENSDWSMSAKPSEGMLIPVECAPRITSMNGLLYVLNGPNVPAGADPKTYMLGKMTIGTKGFQGASVNIGSIYVTYKVKLFKPIMIEPLAAGHLFVTNRTAITAGNLWGASAISTPYDCDTIGVTISGNVLTLSKRRLQIGMCFTLLITYVGTSVSGVTIPVLTMSAGLEGFPTLPDSAGVPHSSVDASAGAGTSARTVTYITFKVKDDTANQTITIAAANPTTPMICVQIFQVSGLLINGANVGFVTP